jgi:hypothetical protein
VHLAADVLYLHLQVLQLSLAQDFIKPGAESDGAAAHDSEIFADGAQEGWQILRPNCDYGHD